MTSGTYPWSLVAQIFHNDQPSHGLLSVSSIYLFIIQLVFSTDYVRFWINTIVTYCKGGREGYPKIMVILTHRDKLKNAVSSDFHDIHISNIK